MGNVLSKKVIIIFSTILAIVLTAVIISVSVGNTRYPVLSNPDGIFYQQLDDNGEVLYSITNKQLFEQVKNNDGIDQLLFLIDNHLLQEYVAAITQEQVDAKILKLKYGTDVQEDIDEIDAETKLELETKYDQSIKLAGFTGNEDGFARISLAREAYARYRMILDGDITDAAVAIDYANNYYEDIRAIRIRFTSSADALAVMKKFNLVILGTTNQTLREYNGYKFTSEALKDPDQAIVEAYRTVTTYYFDASDNIKNLSGATVYTKGTAGYTNSSGAEFTLDVNGNLIDANSTVIIPAAHLFETLGEAETYKANNTTYYTVSKVNAYDADEVALVKDADGVVRFTVDKNNKIYNELLEDVTATTDLIVNKVYTSVNNVTAFTVNNSRSLTDAEVLAKYILMFNYVYGDSREDIEGTETLETLRETTREDLIFKYNDLRAQSATLAAYMFKTINLNSTAETDFDYTVSPRAFSVSGTSFHFLVYKLTQPEKTDYITPMLEEVAKTIVLPAQTAENLTLPTTGAYGSTISWTSANTTIVSNAGVVTKPAEDTDVKLTYTITLNAIKKTGEITVKILKRGDTSPVTNDYVPVTFKSLLNDDAFYDELFQVLVDARMNDSSNGQKYQTEKLTKMRKESGLVIYDRYIALDYQQIDSTFELNKKGHKSLIASLSSRPALNSETKVEVVLDVTADDLYEYALAKNAALYTIYAAQWNEILNSQHFVDFFGAQTDIVKNKSDKMTEMRESVAGFKQQYVYYQQLYAQYNMSFPYATVSDYAYIQLGAKTEADMLQYFVKGALQPHFIQAMIDRLDIIDLLYDQILENYENYFSLKITHLIIHFDFDEDGRLDNYFDYVDGLEQAELDAHEAMKAAFETAILEYLDASTSNSYTTLVSVYNNATREDATWGAYKQAGFLLKTETLSQTSAYDNQTSSPSLYYSGEFGVEGRYVGEYVDAMIALYNEYRLEQNSGLAKLRSPLVTTEFGLHLLDATKGDKFAQPSAKFVDTNNGYDPAVANASDIPSLEQLKLYAVYIFYDLVYDLTDTEVEAKYGIDVPDFPTSVKNALQFYLGGRQLVSNNMSLVGMISEVYTVGALNIEMAHLMDSGRFVATDYLAKSDAELHQELIAVADVYYQAIFAKYE